VSTRELVFSYRTEGARAAQKADERVRSSVRRTGKTAQRNAGTVERWMSRNKRAIQAVGVAAGAALATILSASPTMRAQLGGVRAAFTLFADTIVNDILPAGTSLGKMALDFVTWFRDLPGPIRKAASIFTVLVLAVLAILPIAAALITSFGIVAGAIGTVVAAVSLAAVGIGILIAIVVALAIALIFNVGGARDKVIGFLSDIWQRGKALFGKLWDWVKSAAGGIKDALVSRLMAAKNRVIALAQLLWQGVQNRLTKLRARASQIVTKIRDFIVGKFKNIRERILSLLDLARELASKARDWVGGLIQGTKDRASDLVSAFQDMATQAANAFRAAFNRIIPDSVSIPRVSISIPSVLGGGSVGVGGGSIDIPQLNTGGRIASDGLAMLHAGERVVPAAQVRERGPQPVGGGTTIESIEIVVPPMGDNPESTGSRIAQQLQRQLEDRGA